MPCLYIIPREQTSHIPATLWNQLRWALAVKCLSYVIGYKKMKVKEQQHLVGECYHGDQSKGAILHKDMLCSAQGVYAHLYQQREEQVTGSPSSSSTGEGKLQLKLLYI
jgi:hypothetical protein